jgi:hypothetical protein
MARTPDFSSAIAKWLWARHHAYLLKSEIEQWGNFDADPPVRFRYEEHRDDEYVAVWIDSVKDLPPEWPLLLGDVTNNFRAALDHFAWELVFSHKPPAEPKKRERIQFPICRTTQRDFLGSMRKDRLPGVPIRVAKKLSPLQPYKRRIRSDAWRERVHPLVVLPQINRQDKHRYLPLLLNRPYKWKVTSAVPAGGIVALGPGVPLRPDTEVARIQIPPGYDGEMRVQFDVTTAVSLGNRGPLVPLLKSMEWLVQAVLVIFGATEDAGVTGLVPWMESDDLWPHLRTFPGRYRGDELPPGWWP